jgi:predicted permease
MTVLWNLAYMLALLGIGYGGRAAGIFTSSRTDALTWVAFTVLLPALIFTSTYDQPLGDVVSWKLVAGIYAIILATAFVAWFVHRNGRSDGARSVAIVQSYHSNMGFLGLPIVAATFGGLTTAKASVVLGVGALAHIPLTVLVLVSLNGTDASLQSEFREFLTNPVILALVAGLLTSYLGLAVPASLVDGLSLLTGAALPVALLAVGASLSPDPSGISPWTVGSVVAVKVFVMPLVALLVFVLLNADASTLRAGITMVAMPAAVSTFVYASELGGDTRLASMNVFVTTVVSLFAVSLAIVLV